MKADSSFWKKFHRFLVFFWIALWIAATIFGWIYSVAFVSHISMVALVLGSFAAYQSARVEVKEDDKE